MAVITDVAGAFVAELNAGGFSQPFEAKRCYLPKYGLAEMEDLHVTVVPKGVTILPDREPKYSINPRQQLHWRDLPTPERHVIKS